MIYFLLFLCTAFGAGSVTTASTEAPTMPSVSTPTEPPANPNDYVPNLSPEIYVENTDVHIDPNGSCKKEIGLMINEAPVYLEKTGQSHRINGYYSFGMIDNCGAPFTLEQGSVPSFSTCSIQRCDCNYGVQEWDCVTRECPAHTVWWQDPTKDQAFCSYQSDVQEPSAESSIREQFAFIEGYVSQHGDVVIQRLEYDCENTNLNHICQHLFKNIITNIGQKDKKFSDIHIPMPEHNAKDECECALMPLAEGKEKWKVLVDSHGVGYMFDSVIFTMPEGAIADRQQAVLDFCITKESMYKHRFWKISAKETEFKCRKQICPVTQLKCPPNSVWALPKCPAYDECCEESNCPCCVSSSNPGKCVNSMRLSVIRPQEVLEEAKEHTGLILVLSFIVVMIVVLGFLTKYADKKLNPRNRRKTFSEYIPDCKPNLAFRAQNYSSRLIEEDEIASSFHAMIDDKEQNCGLEPVQMNATS